MTFTLLENNTYIKYNKFNTLHKDNIGWLKYTKLVISFQCTSREKMSYTLLLVHLDKNKI